MPERLNYHHLRYFRVIAQEGSLTRAAERLHVSQSALSIQLRQLEEALGHPLFERRNRRLVLTEAGHVALDHAEAIFRTGDELMATLGERPTSGRRPLRIGAEATLSRNFQLQMLRPLIGAEGVDLVLRSGSLRELLDDLRAHRVDVVLSNMPAGADPEGALRSLRLAEQPVSLVGPKPARRGTFRFPQDLAGVPLVLPSTQSAVRIAFDLMLEEAGVTPEIAAEVDDMAMLRLLAREGFGLSLVPPVVVQDELKSGQLVERCVVPGLHESFHAITLRRRFPNPLLGKLLKSRPRP